MITVIHANRARLDPRRFLPELATAMRQSGEMLAESLREYPKPVPGRKMQFASPRQRTFVRVAIKTGVIEVPYRRTGRLGAAWRVSGPAGANYAVTVFNDPSLAPYGRYVQSDKQQFPFHADIGWPTPKQVIEKNKKAIARLVQEVFRR